MPRAYAFEMWMDAPMPMVTFFKTIDVTRLVRISKRTGLKFNMLMCWCIGRAASGIKEFYTLLVGRKLMRYDNLVICTIVESGPMEVVPELLSLYATQMDRIAKEAKKKMTRTNDFMTKNHLQGIIRRIEVCQNGGEVK